MGYLHIENLYKNQDIFFFKECYALEKIHGSSSHVSFKENQLHFFAGGTPHDNFVKLFDSAFLQTKFQELGIPADDIVIFGEVYGGKVQGQSHKFGPTTKFVAFDVKIGENWLSVPQAESFCKNLNIEFVDYAKIPTTLEAIDKERDKVSTQAIRNGMGDTHKREGVVLRPLIEVKKNNGERVIVKHKIEEERETKTPRPVDEAKLKVLTEAKEIAEEWVTLNRLHHVLQKIENPSIEKMKEVLTAMKDDIKREAVNEIVWNNEVEKAICSLTAPMFKQYLKDAFVKNVGG